MGKEKKCARCSAELKFVFYPMKDWKIEGPICGSCYSKGIDEYYPGTHIRVNREAATD